MRVIIIGKGKMTELLYKWLYEAFENIETYVAEEFPYENYDWNFGSLIISTGDMKKRRELWDRFKEFPFINILRSTPPEEIGKGNIIMSNVSIDPFSKIGHNNIISSGTVISHHCSIGDSNLFGPGCLISGSVSIGSNCTFGSGIIIEPNVSIPDGITIPSGCVIVSDPSSPIVAKRTGPIFSGEYLLSHAPLRKE